MNAVKTDSSVCHDAFSSQNIVLFLGGVSRDKKGDGSLVGGARRYCRPSQMNSLDQRIRYVPLSLHEIPARKGVPASLLPIAWLWSSVTITILLLQPR
jgi:hypothetical protein